MPNKLTKRGYERLRLEFENLSRNERPKVVQGIANAAAEGDRSENAEYIYGKKRLREIDRRLQYLSKLLKNPIVVVKSMVATDKVNFGCRVTLLTEDETEKVWTIVGDGEADLKEKSISINAPVAKALIGKSIGDLAEVELPQGMATFEIISIDVGDIE